MDFIDNLNFVTIITIILIVIVVLDHSWEIILIKRQLIVCQHAIFVPEELRNVIVPELYHRARIYELHKAELYMWKHFIDMLISIAEIFFGFYAFAWNVATNSLSFLTAKEIWISSIFVFYMTIYGFLRFLPIFAYDKLILELRYGTSSYYPCYIYCCISVISIVLSQIVLIPLTIGLIYLVQLTGYYFFLWFWLAWVVASLLTLLFLPWCCSCCYGKQLPIQEGPLHTEIKEVCDRTGFPMDRVFIIHTKTLQYSNAYFYGSCCLKRIVIFDTLLQNKGVDPGKIKLNEMGQGLTNQQVTGVVAHELGHWKKGHFYKATVIMKVHVLLCVLLFGLCYHCPQLYQAVGFKPGVCPIIVGIIIVLRFALTPYLVIANFLMLWNMRRFEYAADKFAHQLGYSGQLRSALIKIYADHMSFPIFDNCYARWHHTHPTILQRLAYQRKLDERRLFA